MEEQKNCVLVAIEDDGVSMIVICDICYHKFKMPSGLYPSDCLVCGRHNLTTQEIMEGKA
jgi:hypothetical protein